MTRKHFTLSLIATALLATAGAAQAQQTINQSKALAGNISPGDEPGFPITISRPGHYKLTGNLSVPAGTQGIVITAHDVTLDMNGFTLAGPNSCTRNASSRVVTCTTVASLVGIQTQGNGVVIRDGAVRGFRYGVHGNEGETLLRMHVTENTLDGVISANTYAGMAIIDSVIDRNGQHGLVLDLGQVRGSRVGHNGGDGIRTGGIVTDSFVWANRYVGQRGGAARGTQLIGNGTNRSLVTSLGANLDEGSPF